MLDKDGSMECLDKIIERMSNISFENSQGQVFYKSD